MTAVSVVNIGKLSCVVRPGPNDTATKNKLYGSRERFE